MRRVAPVVRLQLDFRVGVVVVRVIDVVAARGVRSDGLEDLILVSRGVAIADADLPSSVEAVHAFDEILVALSL